MKNAKLISLILVVQCFLFGKVISAQSEPQSKFYDLKLEVMPFKDKYLPLEPIQLSYKISNPTDSPIEVWWEFANHIFSLEVNKDGKKTVPQLSGIAARRGITLIQPNQKIEGTDVLDFQLSNIFPDYGRYELTFMIYGKETIYKVVSNKIEITIQQPTGTNAEALNFIYKTHELPIALGIFQHWNDKREDKTKYPLEEFVEKYSESVYGDYAIFHLGIAYKMMKKYDLAKKEFNKLKDKKDFAYYEAVTSNLSEIENIEAIRRLEKKN